MAPAPGDQRPSGISVTVRQVLVAGLYTSAQTTGPVPLYPPSRGIVLLYLYAELPGVKRHRRAGEGTNGACKDDLSELWCYQH